MPAISEKTVRDLDAPEKGNKLHYFSGATLQGKKAPSGFAVRVTANGTKSFVWFHRVEGRPHLETLGRWDENAKGGSLTVLQAILAAKRRAEAVEKGEDPRPERTQRLEDGGKLAGETVADVVDLFVRRHVEKDAKLRSGDAIKRIFDRLVKPAIGKIGIYDLQRKQVIDMLDTIADDHGPVMADRTLAYVRKCFNWNTVRDQLFKTPIVKGMARTKPKERARSRTLSDDELRVIWSGSEGAGPFGSLLRFILLTGARRSEAAGMTWKELGGSDWILPAARNKTKVDLVRPLSAKALAVLPKKIDRCAFVFTTDGKTSLSGFSKFKGAFDKAVPLPNWTLHDLRRTARSLMSRAGVPTDHAERCLGHVITGVRSVYDRHEYHREKKAAYETLATLIDQILDPADNVTQLAKRRHG